VICSPRQAITNSVFWAAGEANRSIFDGQLVRRRQLELTVRHPSLGLRRTRRMCQVFLPPQENPSNERQSSYAFAPILCRPPDSALSPGVAKVCCKITTFERAGILYQDSCGSMHRCSSISDTQEAPQTLMVLRQLSTVKAQTPTLIARLTSRAFSNMNNACRPSPNALDPWRLQTRKTALRIFSATARPFHQFISSSVQW